MKETSSAYSDGLDFGFNLSLQGTVSKYLVGKTVPDSPDVEPKELKDQYKLTSEVPMSRNSAEYYSELQAENDQFIENTVQDFKDGEYIETAKAVAGALIPIIFDPTNFVLAGMYKNLFAVTGVAAKAVASYNAVGRTGAKVLQAASKIPGAKTVANASVKVASTRGGKIAQKALDFYRKPGNLAVSAAIPTEILAIQEFDKKMGLEYDATPYAALGFFAPLALAATFGKLGARTADELRFADDIVVNKAPVETRLANVGKGLQSTLR